MKNFSEFMVRSFADGWGESRHRKALERTAHLRWQAAARRPGLITQGRGLTNRSRWEPGTNCAHSTPSSRTAASATAARLVARRTNRLTAAAAHSSFPMRSSLLGLHGKNFWRQATGNSTGNPMTSSNRLPLVGGVVQPQRLVVPPEVIRGLTSYRHACRLAWKLRAIKNLTRRHLAEQAGLYPTHVSDYFSVKENKRELPARHIAATERVLGNTVISQYQAAQSDLTVLEELQAMRKAA